MAYCDDDNILHCDNCDVSENEDDITYSESADKHLCDECYHDWERELGEKWEFDNWLKSQNAPSHEEEIDYTGIRSFPIL